MGVYTGCEARIGGGGEGSGRGWQKNHISIYTRYRKLSILYQEPLP